MKREQIIIIVVLLMLCCSSSAGAVFMMGGEEATGPTGPTGPTCDPGYKNVSGTCQLNKPRYLQIMHTVPKSGFNFTEVEAIGDDKDVNLVLGKVVTASTNYGDPYPISKIVDGSGTFGATLHGDDVSSDVTGPQKITIDMGAEKDLKKVFIHSRQGCCNERNIPFKVQILDSKQVLLKETTPISVVKDRYYFDFSGETVSEIESDQYYA
jgi:hypothetical protein